MGKKAAILATVCIMIVVVVFFEFFVFTTPPQQSNDPYSTQYYDEFNKSPALAYNYNFSPPISMYHALLIALESGGWTESSLINMTVRVFLEYTEFWSNSSSSGSEFLHEVTQPARDYSPVQVNGTTYRYIWDIVVENNVGLQMPPPGLYYVDAATGEIVPTGPLY